MSAIASAAANRASAWATAGCTARTRGSRARARRRTPTAGRRTATARGTAGGGSRQRRAGPVGDHRILAAARGVLRGEVARVEAAAIHHQLLGELVRGRRIAAIGEA